MLAGVGGIGYQNYDYFKHNAIMHDLINHTYPVIYNAHPDQGIGQPSPLVYYIAYYLPAALLGKLVGSTKAAFIFLFLQTLVILSITFGFITTYIKPFKYHILSVVLLMLFSGSDVLASLYYDHIIPPLGHHFEWCVNNMKMQYTSTTVQLFYVPQHMSASFLGVVVALSALRDRAIERYLALLALLPLWSVFVAIGFLPLVLLFVWHNPKEILKKLQWKNLKAVYFSDSTRNYLVPLFFS